MNQTLVFLSGKRTPFGANGGSLWDISPTDLGITAAKAAIEQAALDPKQIDHVIFGNVLHSAPDSIYTPRHIGLRTGVPEEVPALGINRLCGSGFQVVVEAYQQMVAGDTRIALVGGTENMSMSPYVLRNARWGMRMGHGEVGDTMVEALFDTYTKIPMAITAEVLGEKYKVTRQDSDAFALRSQQLYQKALKEGKLKEEIAPISLTDRKGNISLMDKDEHPKADVTAEGLAKLKPVFKKDGIVTAGNASGIVDGASAMVVATEAEAERRGWKPLGRMVSYGISGCDPKIMGIGPAPATREALKRAGLKLSDIDFIEVNEAFSPQTVSVERELGINREVLNVNGGAVAVGHPLAASGTRILLHLLYELRRSKKRYGLGSACIGGGQGIAVIVEAY